MNADRKRNFKILLNKDFNTNKDHQLNHGTIGHQIFWTYQQTLVIKSSHAHSFLFRETMLSHKVCTDPNLKLGIQVVFFSSIVAAIQLWSVCLYCISIPGIKRDKAIADKMMYIPIDDQWLKRMNTQLNEQTNQNSLESSKLLSQRIRQCFIKFWVLV